MGSRIVEVVGSVLKSVSSAVAGVSSMTKGEMKMSKKIFGLVAVFCLLVAIAPKAVFASSTGAVKLTITITAAPDITVQYLKSDTINLSTWLNGIDKSTMTTASITVTNASAALNEDWFIKASDAIGLTDTTYKWTLADAAPASNQYRMYAIFNEEVQPTVAGIEGGTHVTTASQVPATGNGDSVANTAVGETGGLWLKVYTPSALTQADTMRIWVTVLAAQAG